MARLPRKRLSNLRLQHFLPNGYLALVRVLASEQGSEVEGLLLSSESLSELWALLDEFEGDGYERVLTTAKLKDGAAVDAYIYRLRESGPQRGSADDR